MVRETIRMMLPTEKHKQVLDIFRSITGQNRARFGCISSRLYQELGEKKAILFETVWQDQESMESHLCSEEYHNILLVVEMAVARPEIRFDTIAFSTGIETIERVRSRTR